MKKNKVLEASWGELTSMTTTSSTNLFGLHYSSGALNDEESQGGNISTVSTSFDQLYLGTVNKLSSGYDTDRYSFNVEAGESYALAISNINSAIAWNAQSITDGEAEGFEEYLKGFLYASTGEEYQHASSSDLRFTSDARSFVYFTAPEDDTLTLELK